MFCTCNIGIDLESGGTFYTFLDGWQWLGIGEKEQIHPQHDANISGTVFWMVKCIDPDQSAYPDVPP